MFVLVMRVFVSVFAPPTPVSYDFKGVMKVSNVRNVLIICDVYVKTAVDVQMTSLSSSVQNVTVYLTLNQSIACMFTHLLDGMKFYNDQWF